MIGNWPAPLPDGSTSDEMVVKFDSGRSERLLIIPPLFEEANTLRRFTIEVMRRLDESGKDTFLPDLAGLNESLAPLAGQSLSNWQRSVSAAQLQFGATHILGIRSGALLLAPDNANGFVYAPQSGANLLRNMLRARIIASREYGIEETTEQLSEEGRVGGLELAGWAIGSTLFRELETAKFEAREKCIEIEQDRLGGAGLWLRAEPADDDNQSRKLALLIQSEMSIR
ncbi:MAG: hypothetical protein ABJP48_01405 [Erythrobacter sp.]